MVVRPEASGLNPHRPMWYGSAMLATLRVRHFVLIDELEVSFGTGLNVLTGETGAGKSIVVDAIGLVLGNRASPDLVRAGEEEAEVEALFEVGPDSPLVPRLLESGVPFDGELVIRRTVAHSGRSRAYLNGRLTTAAELSSVAPLLIDIASQHESVSLTDPATHVAYLDTFARLAEDRGAVEHEVDALMARVAEARALAEQAKSRVEREAFLRFQLQAIEEVDPRPGEGDDLQRERSRLRHGTKLQGTVQRATLRLSEGEAPLLDDLARVTSELRSVAELDEALAEAATSLDNARTEVEEAARFLSRYLEGLDVDPSRLEEVEARLFALQKLERQHGPTLEDVLTNRDKLLAQLAELDGAEEAVEAARQACAGQHQKAAKLAKELSKKRVAAADTLANAITRELAALGMGAAKVEVAVQPLGKAPGGSAANEEPFLIVEGARLSRDGIDRVEFLIAPNKGMPPKPLRKVASGGELSRALLALKRVLAEGAPAGTYIFDEVDTGVGGQIAERIGRALADVARHRQVICITHLAPIAAFGQSHFVIEKDLEGSVTKSRIRPVVGKARVHEVARMLSGAKVTDSAKKAAAEMIAEAARPESSADDPPVA
jgi:DNA repair protein RecN (Recombination protein N)